jgi:hypothetical protein
MRRNVRNAKWARDLEFLPQAGAPAENWAKRSCVFHKDSGGCGWTQAALTKQA